MNSHLTGVEYSVDGLACKRNSIMRTLGLELDKLQAQFISWRLIRHLYSLDFS